MCNINNNRVSYHHTFVVTCYYHHPTSATHSSLAGFSSKLVNSSLACCTCPDLRHQVERMQEQIDNMTQSQNEAILQTQYVFTSVVTAHGLSTLMFRLL